MIASTPPRALQRPELRRALTMGILISVCLLVLPAASARADSPNQLTVVGTSDVQDSGLMPKLIMPMFQKAFPQFTLKYVSVGTGVAINDAETGVASALLVHAASLENQFVAQGFSLERFGRAIFYGDYVLLGPASDPAGVLTNAPHDIAAAFARIATAGAAGKADFVSRGGTPGTTVQEHAIWALNAGTPGLALCDVSTANGGGEAPSTASGPCPTSTANPPWYHTTGLTQGPNVEAANTCNFTNASNNGGNDCYAITDRGTFSCLMSAQCAGGSAAPTNLRIVTRDNSSTAKGGSRLLVNSFHAYAINPAKFAGNSNVQLNSVAAKDFLDFITSPSFQAQLRAFLGQTSDPPFIADAAPAITASQLPSKVTGGQKITVSGTLRNVVPGTPALDSVPVTLSEVGSGLGVAVPVATSKTDSTGAYRITFSAPSTGSYQVSTGPVIKVQNVSLNPVFADLLQPAATTPSRISVQGALQGLAFNALPGRVLVSGSVLPGASHVKGTIVLLGRGTKHGRLRTLATSPLGSQDDAFAISATSRAGRQFLEVRFQDPGQVLSTTTKAANVLVPAPSPARVATTSLKVKNGQFTIGGKVSPTPTGSGTTVQVLGLDIGALSTGGRSNDSAHAAATGSVRFKVLATVEVRAGETKFAVKGKLTRGQRWALLLRYATGGRAGSGYGVLKTVRVT